jgi:hypothetical protein
MVKGERGALTEVEPQALIEGSDSQGGFLMPTPLAPVVLDMVPARTVVVQAGATVQPMTSETLSVRLGARALKLNGSYAGSPS